jgi:hypothetical protein
MLGQFLEVSLVAPDAMGAWLGWQQLGFAPATTGDVFAHAYGVVACEHFALGLHEKAPAPLCVNFVRPEVARAHRELVAAAVPIETATLGSDVFNALALREPGGCLLQVLEARTFSPPATVPEYTALGRFVALSLPCSDLPAARDFWQRLERNCDTLAQPWDGLSVSGTPLYYHAQQDLPEPALLFDEPDSRLIELMASGELQQAKPVAAFREREHLLLRSTEQLAIMVLQ